MNQAVFPTIAAAMAFWSKNIKPRAASFRLADTHRIFGVTFYADPHDMWRSGRTVYWTRTVVIPPQNPMAH